MAQKRTSNRPPKQRQRKPRQAASSNKPIRREVGAVVCLVLGLITFLGYFISDYWLIDGIGLYVFRGLFGLGYLLVPPVLFWMAWVLTFHRGRPVKKRIISLSFLPFLWGAVMHLTLCSQKFGYDLVSIRSLYLSGMNRESGGVLSGLLGITLERAISMWGAIPVLSIAVIICIFLAAQLSLRELFESIKNRPRREYRPVPVRKAGKKDIHEKPIPAADPYMDDPATVYSPEIFEAPKQKNLRRKNKAIDIPMDDVSEQDDVCYDEVPKEESLPEMPQGLRFIQKYSELISEEYTREEKLPSETVPFEPDFYKEPDVSLDESDLIIDPQSQTLNTPPYSDAKSASSVFKPVVEAETEAAVSREDTIKAAQAIDFEIANGTPADDYTYPPVELLSKGTGASVDGKDEVLANQERLELALHSFGIAANVIPDSTTRGPSVTRYELKLDSGVKLNKLVNLADDLALSLGVASVRIAPIPEKISTVGVEVPNKAVSTVFLREIIESKNFQNSASKLSFSIGKDIAGNCIVGNISKLPHLLIAGTTGSGKSVCMNSLILSLLYKSSPQEVRLIMVDPKMVELGIYNGIPHLYIPVVTDPKKAAGALQWSVVEMLKRYRQFSEVGVRDLKGYNSFCEKNGRETLPNVVIVIDELADLMMTAAKEVEESICRVAQMGRAAGMHLIIATQRPSADVITGLMKANIPSRIAFAVSSSLESRIIMDQQGAEKLIGMGDMLYAPLGCGKPMRVQGAFVSDEEREKVISYIKDRASADYDDEILQQIEKVTTKDSKDTAEEAPAESRSSDDPFSGYDELLSQAVDVIMDSKQASVSMLQRRLKLGYSRAARLVDQMEELGIVGPFEGSKPRQLLITKQQWQEMSMGGKNAAEQLMEEQKDDFSEGNNL